MPEKNILNYPNEEERQRIEKLCCSSLRRHRRRLCCYFVTKCNNMVIVQFFSCCLFFLLLGSFTPLTYLKCCPRLSYAESYLESYIIVLGVRTKHGTNYQLGRKGSYITMVGRLSMCNGIHSDQIDSLDLPRCDIILYDNCNNKFKFFSFLVPATQTFLHIIFEKEFSHFTLYL